jgi:predicted adenylyl cyclase CyaB
MNSNIEIKAAVRNWDRAIKKARELSGGPAELIEQEDTFFNVPKGRLKMRKFLDGSGELIYYERPDTSDPCASLYNIFRTPDAYGLTGALAMSLGIRGVVKKKRHLFLAGRTRIHLDEVEGLVGSYLELEVVLRDGEDPENGTAEAQRLMAELGIKPQDLIDKAYIDLLAE